MNQSQYNQLFSFLWNIANDVLVQAFEKGKYKEIIMSMLVLRRLDIMLEPTKEQVLERKALLEQLGLPEASRNELLKSITRLPYFNVSPYTMKSLRGEPNSARLLQNFRAYLGGFSDDVQDIIGKFDLMHHAEKLNEVGRLGAIIEKFTDERINLGITPVVDDKGNEILPALDNHTMGTLFEELQRRFNEGNNVTEAGEHFAPRTTIKADGAVKGTGTATREQDAGMCNVEASLDGPEEFTVNGVTFRMIPVEGGTFTMGATGKLAKDSFSDEKPVQSVTLSSYKIGETEVTQALWKAVMGSNPSYFKGDDLPVEEVSWDDCQEFIKKLNTLTGMNFRLPTEAEWEYAAKGGNKAHGYLYSGSDNPDSVAWHKGNSGIKTHPVGTKAPNELGIYDMTGNVLEWCSDWYGSYQSSSQTNPTGSVSGTNRVHRGGCWNYAPRNCRVSYRSSDAPDYRNSNLGFRLALL